MRPPDTAGDEARGAVLHVEGGTMWPLGLWLVLSAAAIAGFYVAAGADHALGAAMAALACLPGVAALNLSNRRYARVTITSSTLRVGRERFALADLDLDLLERQLDGDGERERLLPRGARRGRGDIRVVGGAWAPRFGDRFIVIARCEDAQPLAVGTWRPRRLLQEMLTAAGRTPPLPRGASHPTAGLPQRG